VGTGSGWEPFGPERLITKSGGTTLYEFDGRSALSLYKEYLGEFAQGLPFTALRFPMGLRGPEGHSWDVRVIVGIDERQGSLSFDCDIAERSSARFMVGNLERLIEGALAAARANYEQLDAPAQLAIMVSCFGRRYVLGQNTEEEVEVVGRALGERTKVTGFYSYGEISAARAGAPSELYNQTMTLTSFAEA